MFVQLCRSFLILVFLILGNKIVYSQNDTCFLGNLIEYRIVNEDFANFLDSTIEEISLLDEFKVLKSDLFTILYIVDTNNVRISITPYSYNQFNLQTFQRNDKFTGYLFLNGHLILVGMEKFESAKSLLEKTERYKEIRFVNNENIAYHVMPSRFVFYGELQNGIFSLIDEEYNTEKIKGCYYIYKIKSSDTWEKLTEKFQCSEIELKMKKDGDEKLVSGSYIYLKIIFANGQVEQVYRDY